MLILPLIMVISQTNKAYADEAKPKSMMDVATEFGNAGGYYAAGGKDGKDPKQYDNLKDVYQVWNYLAPGKHSILASSSKGSAGATYDALANAIPQSGNDNVRTAAKFANALQNTGLDHASSGGLNTMVKAARHVGGWLLSITLWFMLVGDSILDIAYKIFKWINPFFALRYLVSDKAISGSNGSLWQPIMDLMRPTYTDIRNVAITFAICAFAVGMMMALLGKRLDGGPQGGFQAKQESLGRAIGLTAFRFLRRVFIGFAAPVIIAVLSADLLEDAQQNSSVVGNIGLYQIYRNFIDFNGWVNYSRLALPANSSLDQNGSASLSPNFVYQINAQAANNKNAQAANDKTAELAKGNKGKNGMALQEAQKAVSSTSKWLTTTYASGATIGSSDYESFLKSVFRRKATTDGKKQGDKGVGDIIANPILHIAWAKTDSEWNNKSQDAYGTVDNDMKNPYAKDGSITYDSKKGVYTSDKPQNASVGYFGKGSKVGGLSTIGMYNYLNTTASGSNIYYTQPTQFLGINTQVQHTAAGMVGRGFNFFGSYILLLTTMITSTLIVLFVAIIILEGALTGIPRILIYSIELGTLQWQGFIGVVKEVVAMYARLILGTAITFFYANSMSKIFDQFNTFLVGDENGNGGVFGMIAAQGWMPFQLDASWLGVAKIVEAIVTAVFMGLMLKSFRDVIKAINKLISKLMNLAGAGSMNGKGAPKPNMGKMGINNNSQNNPNDPKNSSDTDNLNANTADAVKDRMKEASLNDNAKNKSIGNSLKSQAALLGLDAMDKMGASPVGKAAKGMAEKGMAALGGSKLGARLGLKGRGDGMGKIDKMDKMIRQNLANAADPKQSENAAKATMTEKEQKDADSKLENDQMSAGKDTAMKALERSQKEHEEKQKKHSQLANDMKDIADGKKDSSQKAAQALEDVAKENLPDKDGAQASKQAKDLNSAYKSQAEDALKNSSVESLAKDVDTAQDELDKAQEQADKDETQEQEMEERASQGDEEAQATLPEYQRRTQQSKANVQSKKRKLNSAKQNLEKAKVASNPAQAAAIMKATGKSLGVGGQNLEKANDKMKNQVHSAQFTAMTGKLLPQDKAQAQSLKADNATKQKAQQAIKKADKVLNNKNATQAQKAQAKQMKHDAQVVTKSGYQYGQFANSSNKQAINHLQQASDSTMKSAQSLAQRGATVDSTGFVVRQSANDMTDGEKAFVNNVEQAQQTVSSGMVQSESGQMVPATSSQMQQAQQTLQQAAPQQVADVQAQMVNTATAVSQEAEQYGNQEVQAQLEQNGGSLAQGAKQQIMQQAVQSYYNKPAVAKRLQSAGFVSPSVNAQQFEQQVSNAQQMGQQTRAVMNASVAPLRRQIQSDSAAPVMPNDQIIREVGNKEALNIPASASWVDTAHYNKTTVGHVQKATQQLVNAQVSGNQDAIQKAQFNAAKLGISNSIINDTERAQSVLNEIQGMQNNVVRQAVQQGGQTAQAGLS